MEKLALLGGKPVRDTKIYYGQQYIDEDDIAAVCDTLRSSLITTGPRVEQAERMLCEKTGAQYATVVANGTAALHLACLSLNLRAGDEVITTPMTFAASANVVRYCGGTVVFADINPETYNMDPADIERKITGKTRAVIAVDYTGQVVEMERIRTLCDRHGLVLIEDAAHSLGSKYNGRPVGSLADMTCFSFHPVKTVTAGEGGAVLTNSPERHKFIESNRTHGIVREEADFINPSHGGWYQEQLTLGYNYRMTDFQAALLCSQLSKLDLFAKRRQEICSRYDAAFAQIPELILQKEIPQSNTVKHIYVLQLALEKLNCTRKEFYDAMYAENVACQIHYIPVYYHPYYQQLGYPKGLCPHAEHLYEGIVSIPLYYSLTDADVADTIHAVTKIIEWYRKG